MISKFSPAAAEGKENAYECIGGLNMSVVRHSQKSMPVINKVTLLSSILYIFSLVFKGRMRFIPVNLTSMQQQVSSSYVFPIKYSI